MSANLRALAERVAREWADLESNGVTSLVDLLIDLAEQVRLESRRELLEAVRADRIVATDYRTHADWCPYAHRASNCGCGLFDRVTAARAHLDAALLELDDAKGKVRP